MESNTTVITSLLSFLLKCFHYLQQQQYQVQTNEIEFLIYTLINQILGHNNQRFRIKCNELLQQLVYIYTPRSMLIHLLHHIDHKNSKVISMIMQCIMEIIKTHGITICNIKALYVRIALKLTDSTHRDITLATLCQLYQYISKDIVDIQQLWKNHSKLKHLTNEYKLFYKKVNITYSTRQNSSTTTSRRRRRK